MLGKRNTQYVLRNTYYKLMLNDEPVRRNFTAMYVAFGLMFVLLAGQLYHLQIMDGSKYNALAEQNRARVVPVKATRGIIYDRTGQRLVVNDPSYAVSLTPADIAGLSCDVSNLARAAVFSDLAKLLEEGTRGTAHPISVTNIIVVKPFDLPRDKQGEVANRLSVLLQTPADNIRAPLSDTMKSWPDSKNIFPIRRDVPDSTAQAIKAEAKNLPGITVYSEIEYNFVKGVGKCFNPVVVLRGIDYNTMQLVEAGTAKLAGVSVAPEPVRQYVNGSLFSHLLGYVGPISDDVYSAAQAKYGDDNNPYQPDDKVGQTGLEASLDTLLRGQRGQRAVIVDSLQRVVSEVSSTPPVTGNNVTLTLDANLQKAVTESLQRGLQNAKVNAGVAVVMRVDNGQILSMVSLPSYDNNLFTKGISQKDFDTLNTDPTKPLFNRAVSGVYPPGSTYKMISAAAALQENVVKPDTTFNCPGYIEVPYTNNEGKRNLYKDWKTTGHGVINIVQALTVSSDVFFYIAAGPHQEDRRIHEDNGTDKVTYLRYYTPGGNKPIEFNGLGIDRLHQYATAFGLGQKTGVDLPGESSGTAPSATWLEATYPGSHWSLGDTLVSAIGQGYDLVTPLQLVNVTAAVANGGTLYKPQLVEKVTDSSGNVVQDYQPKVNGQVPISPENLAIVREGMRQVVTNQAKGTAATHIKLTSIEWAGKTGTAEYGDPIGKKNGKDVRRSHAWFTAFAPFDKPEIAVVVLLEGGQESLEGSTFAVPITDEIMQAYFHKDK